MSHPSRHAGTPAQDRQRGVSLVIVLVLLVATSILGIAVLRSTAMQERMSANQRDRSLAFQAAESALRYAQDVALTSAAWETQVPTAVDCTNFSICPEGSAPAWREVPAGAFDSARLAAPPEYWIEYLGTGPGRKGSCDVLPPTLDCQSPMYRVSARSRAAGRADVQLQANIISRIPDPGT
ncbi:pilus assembly protein [Luteimonas sp. MC1782]|uniref:pilus assembly PilX family protein n=1 Tax=Luteimonas sp. MC1782 TaxID=2760305 RepID=UPI001603BC6E|nr:PilX N-terminal domain-containing pilus assembly protein [Luteimonas sp. MC1782]MBB1472616.1 pilus assembly protein [Luteimonas sp. MC1782]